MLSYRQNSSYAKSTVNSIYIHFNNIVRVSKHSVTIRGLRVVTTCWSWAWSNRTSPSKWVGLVSPLAACSVYGDLTCSVHTVNNLYMFSCQCHVYLCNRGPYVRLAFVPNMLSSWNILLLFIIIKICLTLTDGIYGIYFTMSFEMVHGNERKCNIPDKLASFLIFATDLDLGIPIYSNIYLWLFSIHKHSHWRRSNDNLENDIQKEVIFYIDVCMVVDLKFQLAVYAVTNTRDE